MPPMIWQARTVKHVLIDRYGMNSVENPTVQCACGRRVHADVCVDLTPLPIGIRKALNLHLVDYLCDGCQTRLFRELHIGEEEFYGLLGAPEEAKVFHRERDPQHQTGCELRPEAFKPKHQKVTRSQMVGKKLGEIAVVAAIPLSRNRRSHDEAAQAVHNDPDSGIEFDHFRAIPLAPAAGVSLPIDSGDSDPARFEPAAISPIDVDELPADEPLPAGVAL